MKVTVLGGLGKMGQAVIRDLVKHEIFDSILVADILISEERIPEKVKGDQRVKFEEVDLFDHDKLVKLLKGSEIVVNCAGPFYKTAIPVIKAAIEVRSNYIDICDDYEATELLFSSEELQDEVKKAGITVLTGMGSDPGTNNILVKWYASMLDEIDDILLYWIVSIAEISGAAMDHSLHMVLGTIPQYIDGRLERVEAGGGEEKLEFLPPLNTCTVRYVGHPQPLTIPRYIPKVKNVIIKGGLIPQWVDDYIMKQKEMGLLDKNSLKCGEVFVDPYDFTLKVWEKILNSREDKGPVASGLKVVVRGKRKDKELEFQADIVGRMAPGTGLPCAIGTVMMAKGQIKEKGILAPEGCVDPKEFITEFIRKGAKIHQRVTEKKVLKIEDLETNF